MKQQQVDLYWDGGCWRQYELYYRNGIGLYVWEAWEGGRSSWCGTAIRSERTATRCLAGAGGSLSRLRPRPRRSSRFSHG